MAIIWKGSGGVEIAGLSVNLRGFNSRRFGHQDKKPFKDFETFFRMARYLVQQGESEVGVRANRFQVHGLFEPARAGSPIGSSKGSPITRERTSLGHWDSGMELTRLTSFSEIGIKEKGWVAEKGLV